MKPIKTALAGLAIAGLAIAQPALAASASTARAGSATTESEHLGGGFPSAAVPAVIAMLAVAIFALISASNDDDAPVSP